MNNKEPLVSVIMPVYNSCDYLQKSISSVLMQTYKNLELIIIDDCSTDNSMDLINNINDKRIKIIKNKSNMGAAFSRNIGIENAKGKYIAFLDSDDYWNLTKIEKQVTFMQENNYHFSYTNYEMFDVISGMKKIVSGPRKVTKYKLNQTNWLGCLTVMYDLEYVGKTSIPLLKRRNDYAMWLLVIESANCYLLDDVLAYYNHRPGTISNVTKLNKIKSTQIMYEKVKNRGAIVSWIMAIRCGIWSIYKKLRYEKKI